MARRQSSGVVRRNDHLRDGGGRRRYVYAADSDGRRVVWLGTTGVSRLMTFCVLAKILLLILLFGGLLTQVDVPSLFAAAAPGNSYWPYALGVLPFCLASLAITAILPAW